jgi:hypothetical protein
MIFISIIGDVETVAANKKQKQRQLLLHLQDLLQNPKTDLRSRSEMLEVCDFATSIFHNFNQLDPLLVLSASPKLTSDKAKTAGSKRSKISSHTNSEWRRAR